MVAELNYVSMVHRWVISRSIKRQNKYTQKDYVSVFKREIMNTMERTLKARVTHYQRKVEEEAEEHIVRLTEARSAIEKNMAECENFLKTSHVINITKERWTMLNLLHCRSTDNLNFSECDTLQGLG